jgi:hypothetical protein
VTAPVWRTASRCANGNCVQVATLPSGQVLVRDSKNPAGMPLVFTPEEWRDFLAGVRDGEFDFPEVHNA